MSKRLRKNKNRTGRSRPIFSFMAGFLSALLLSGLLSFGLYRWYNDRILALIHQFLEEAYRVERLVVENHPVYEDWKTDEKEKELRLHLQADHMKQALLYGVGPVRNDSEIADLLSEGKLSTLEGKKELPCYFYNVRKKYRVLTPRAKRGLEALVERFQSKFSDRGMVPVKLALSSVLRPTSYQKNLRGRNANAALESSHSYGTSFDIFYDDFYVSLPSPRSEGAFSLASLILKKVRIRQGYLLGDSLKGQFHAALAQSLIELQREGILYAIHEKRQRVYHVTITSVD